ncbi:MAG: hypothetical protein P3W94_009575 [Paracoccus sp. (in: a-proteobacteria)]|nr:hypothetical protein [Paracoccus sp. (in: a-proteobacteria)]
MFPVKNTLLAGAALMALMAPALAEELRGRVTESFGNHVTIEDRGTSYLIRLPDGTAAPEKGARIIADGALEGRTLNATRIVTEASPDAEDRRPRDRDEARDRGPRDRDEARDRGPRDRDGARDRGPRDRDGAQDSGSRGLNDLVAADAAPRQPDVTHMTLRHRSRSGDLHWSGRRDSGQIRVVSEWDGTIKRVETDGTALPRPMIEQVIPLRLSDLASADRLEIITRAEQRPRGEIVLRGRDTSGSDLEIRYDRRGQLDRIERLFPLPGLDRDSVIKRLSTAGSTNIGWIGYGPRHVEAEAVNPYGERVEVRLNREGQIDRERLLN